MNNEEIILVNKKPIRLNELLTRLKDLLRLECVVSVRSLGLGRFSGKTNPIIPCVITIHRFDYLDVIRIGVMDNVEIEITEFAVNLFKDRTLIVSGIDDVVREWKRFS